jgi:predicted phage tail protein
MVTLSLPDGRTIPISHPVISNRPFKGDRLVKVRLYGRLARIAGRGIYELAVSSVREAITALHCLTETRTSQYIDRTSHTVKWRVVVNGEQIDGSKDSVADELMIEKDGIETIDIYPVPEGGANWLGLIFGAILLVVGLVLAFVPAFAAFAAIGVGMIVSGVAGILGGLLSLFDKPATTPKQKKTQNNPSYLFSGTVNSQDQGGPVPVAYGNLIVGSQCIAAYITNSDLFFAAAGGNGTEWQVSAGSELNPPGVRAAKGAPGQQAAPVPVTRPWNQMGSQGFWGYVTGSIVVPFVFNVPTQQTPHPFDPGPWWLMRTENGALVSNYGAGGNLGPWDTLRDLPQEVNPVVLTQQQDEYIGWAPTRNQP